MTKNAFFFIGLFILAITSCKNDFDLIEEGGDIPVVYGFVNITDSVQYIRVQKGFADENTNAVTLAKQADQVYYDNADVTLTNLNGGSVVTLERVNAADEGFVRDEGDFLDDPNYVYKVRTSELDFAGGDTALLTIVHGEDGEITTGRTVVLPPIKMNLPNPKEPKIGFGSTNFRIQLNLPKSIAVIGVSMALKVRESDLFDPTIVDTVTVPWLVTNNGDNDNPRSDIVVLEFESSQFFQTLKNQLDPNKQVLRRFAGLDLEVLCAGREILEYRKIALANAGLTGSLELPLYSSLDNGKGMGIFSSKSFLRVEDVILDQRSRDSLANGQITGDLNFIF